MRRRESGWDAELSGRDDSAVRLRLFLAVLLLALIPLAVVIGLHYTRSPELVWSRDPGQRALQMLDSVDSPYWTDEQRLMLRYTRDTYGDLVQELSFDEEFNFLRVELDDGRQGYMLWDQSTPEYVYDGIEANKRANAYVEACRLSDEMLLLPLLFYLVEEAPGQWYACIYLYRDYAQVSAQVYDLYSCVIADGLPVMLCLTQPDSEDVLELWLTELYSRDQLAEILAAPPARLLYQEA